MNHVFRNCTFGEPPWPEPGISHERFAVLMEGHCPACKKRLARQGDEAVCLWCKKAYRVLATLPFTDETDVVSETVSIRSNLRT